MTFSPEAKRNGAFCDHEAQAIYIKLDRNKRVDRTSEVGDLILDHNRKGDVIGVEIIGLNEPVDLKPLTEPTRTKVARILQGHIPPIRII